MPNVVCPACESSLDIPDKLAGKRVKCPDCGGPVSVPHPDDEDDSPPRRERRRPAKAGFPKWAYFAIGGGALAVVGLLVILFTGGPPKGYATAGDSAGGFRVYLPGTPRKGEITINGQRVPDTVQQVWASTIATVEHMTVYTVVSTASPYFKPYPADQIENQIALGDRFFGDKRGFEVTRRTTFTLDGKPAVEIRTREHRELERGEPPAPASEFAKRRHIIWYATSNGKKLVVIKIERGAPIEEEAELKAIHQSFKFR